ncbi:hypothetical protein [Streptacidiphilus neutrinimicus]|uniref:hypothetical protein n=1 Tax=Streptacidiphilus neutrinimicus TaxID=105420 RepID=UPI0005A9B17F|nr:hypothetical protein [Streptacidiphilus neutrinimicus]
MISITLNPDGGVTAEGGDSAAHDIMVTLGWIPKQSPGRLWQALPPGLTPAQERAAASRTADLLHAAGHRVELAPELDVEPEPLRLDAGNEQTASQTIAALTERLSQATSAAEIAEITAQVTDQNNGALHHLFAFFPAAVERIAKVTAFTPDPDPQVQARIDEAMQAAMVFTLDEAEIPAAVDHLLHAFARAMNPEAATVLVDRLTRQAAAAPALRPVSGSDPASLPTALPRSGASRRGSR